MSMRYAVIVLAIFAAGSDRDVLAAGATSDPQLELRVSVDRHEFLPGEPVVIGVTLKNPDGMIFRDLSPMDPRQGFLTFSVAKDDRSVPWASSEETWLFSREGPQLEPGDELCDVFDLTEYFGTRARFAVGGKLFAFRHAFEPGSYSVRTGYRARLGVRKDLGQVTVMANNIRFIVRDVTAIPESEIAAFEFLQPSDGHVPGRSVRRWEDMVARGLGRSRYLLAIARSSLPSGDSVDVGTLADEFAARTGSSLAAAGVLRLKYQRFYGKLSANEAWLKRAGAESRGGRFSCYLRMWREILAQRRKYGEVEE